MQPYFLPYIGYFQLIHSVDLFITYDNIKYTKKGWINRNRILENGKDRVISIPLKNDSDFLDIREREISSNFSPQKLLNTIYNNYRKAPQLEIAFEQIERIVKYDEKNLFKFLHNSINVACDYLKIKTPIIISSEVEIDHNLKGSDKVLALCKAVKTDTYINAIGGFDLYSKLDFMHHKINLKFIESNSLEYQQYSNDFVPWLSIIDVMMFNDVETIKNNLLTNIKFI